MGSLIAQRRVLSVSNTHCHAAPGSTRSTWPKNRMVPPYIIQCKVPHGCVSAPTNHLHQPPMVPEGTHLIWFGAQRTRQYSAPSLGCIRCTPIGAPPSAHMTIKPDGTIAIDGRIQFAPWPHILYLHSINCTPHTFHDHTKHIDWGLFLLVARTHELRIATMSASLFHASTALGGFKQHKASRTGVPSSRPLKTHVLAISKGSKASQTETKRDVTANAASTVAPPSAKASKQSVLSKEIAADTYKDMVLGREFEEMCAQMYYRGKMFGYGVGGLRNNSLCVPTQHSCLCFLQVCALV